jgi:hypothetical protein
MAVMQLLCRRYARQSRERKPRDCRGRLLHEVPLLNTDSKLDGDPDQAFGWRLSDLML